MDDEKAAHDAIKSLNGFSVKGRNIKVEKSESKGPKKPSQKLFIGNLAEGTTAEQIRVLFEDFTPVIEADIIKNYGFVHIDADAGRSKINEILKELNGYNLNGSNIRVQVRNKSNQHWEAMSLLSSHLSLHLSNFIYYYNLVQIVSWGLRSSITTLELF